MTPAMPAVRMNSIFDAQAELSYAVARAASAPTAKDRNEWLALARRSLALIGELIELAEMEAAA